MSDIGEIADRSATIQEFAAGYFHRLTAVLESMDLDRLAALAQELDEARQAGQTVFIAGNGGSATTASTMSNDLGFDILKKTGTQHAFRIHPLTDTVGAITAIGNDVGFERIFVDQLRVSYRPGDKLIVISASGNSPNLVLAAEWVKAAGGTVLGLLGFTGGRLLEICDIAVHFRSHPGEYGPVEDAHLVVNHVLAHWYQAKLGAAEDHRGTS